MVDKLATGVEAINRKELLAVFQTKNYSSRVTLRRKILKTSKTKWVFTQYSGQLQSVLSVFHPPSLPSLLKSTGCQKTYVGSKATGWRKLKFHEK